MNHTKEDVREVAAVLVSLLCVGTMDEDKLKKTIEWLLKNLESKSLETQHGAALTLGHVVERKATCLARDADVLSVVKNWTFYEKTVVELG